MRVPLLDLKAQLAPIEQEIKAAVLEVIESTRYVGGPKITQIEGAIAEYVGAQHGVAVSSGTDALLVSLMAFDVGPGDLVVTTPYSFFATAGAVARLGATPVLIDIELSTYNLDPSALEAWVAANPEKVNKVKAIIPVHLYGQSADLDPIMKIATQHGWKVIEDAAQAIGTRYVGQNGVTKVGTVGDVGCFSFFPSKNLGAMGDGGMVTTNDAALAERLTTLRNHGSKPKYYNKLVGGNFRLDPMQAAVLLVKLPHLESWHRGRQENAAYYDKHLEVPGIVKPHIQSERAHHIYNQYVVRVPDRRDDLRAYLKEKDIGHEVYYPVSFHEQECFKYLGYALGDFPNSEKAARHSLAIPVYPELTTDMQDYVIEQLGAFYG